MRKAFFACLLIIVALCLAIWFELPLGASAALDQRVSQSQLISSDRTQTAQAIAGGGGIFIVGGSRNPESLFSVPLPTDQQIKHQPVKLISPATEGSQLILPARNRSYDAGFANRRFSPSPLKREALENHFNSLDVSDERVYIRIQFEGSDGDPSPQQLAILEKDGVELYGYRGDHTYFASAPAYLFRTKSYDFVRWADVISKQDKEGLDLSVSSLSSEELSFVVSLYSVPTSSQLDALRAVSGVRILSSEDTEVLISTVSTNINSILDLEFVKGCELNSQNSLNLDRSIPIVATDYVWSTNDASGITVAVSDAGIQHTHPHFSSSTIYDASDYVDGDNYPEANATSHGIGVAGIVSGQGTNAGRTLKAASYNANLLIQRRFNDVDTEYGPSPSLATIWTNMLDPDSDGNYVEQTSADIISISWGTATTTFDGEYTSQSEEVDETVNGDNGKKVLVVMSSGNDGDGSFPKVNPPSTAKNALTVGASADYISDTLSFYDPSNLFVVNDSSRRTEDGRVKPDVLAPGAYITSPALASTYALTDGTSYATPHVSAIAAQILKQYPSLSPAGIKAFIISETVGGGTTNNLSYNQGWGRVDADRALFQLNDEYYDAYAEGNIIEGSSICYDIPVPSAADQLVVTLVWSDRDGERSAERSLYNDLDLWLKNNSGAILTWTQNDDNLNNVEKYKVQSPAQGTWQACISALDISGFQSSQDYAFKVQVLKRTTTPSLTVTPQLGQSSVLMGQSTSLSVRIDPNGLFAYDLEAKVNLPNGTTLTSGALDESDPNRDKIGDIPVEGTRLTRTWTIRGDTIGAKNITINITGKRIDGGSYNSLGSVVLNVVNQTNSTLPAGNVTICNQPGYDQCISFDYGTCSVSLAVNHYTSVNNIRWGVVNDTSDPYVIRNYTFGWNAVDAEQTYYDINDPNGGGCQFGGCTGELVPRVGTRATVFAPGIASREEILAYDDTTTDACWVWFLPFSPNYGTTNPIYALSCFADSDCFTGTYCNKTSSNWRDWTCATQKSNGQSCTLGTQCQSGFCDNDTLGLSNDNWCFSPTNISFDSQEPNYCEVSTGYGIAQCDERQVGENYTSCTTAGKSYFADGCSGLCGGQDRDTVCRSSDYALGCTAHSLCDGVVAGTGACNLDCSYNAQPPSNTTLLYPNGDELFSANSTIPINWSLSTDPDNWFVTYALQYSNNSGTNWYNILSNYGYENKLNNSLTQQSFNYTGSGNKTVYLRIPKNAQVRNAQLDITGWAM